MDIKAASRVGSGRAHPGPLAPNCILLGSVVCCSDRPDLSLGENLCVFRSAKFCSDPGRSAKFTANIQDLNISDPVIIGCKTGSLNWVSGIAVELVRRTLGSGISRFSNRSAKPDVFTLLRKKVLRKKGH